MNDWKRSPVRVDLAGLEIKHSDSLTMAKRSSSTRTVSQFLRVKLQRTDMKVNIIVSKQSDKTHSRQKPVCRRRRIFSSPRLSALQGDYVSPGAQLYYCFWSYTTIMSLSDGLWQQDQ